MVFGYDVGVTGREIRRALLVVVVRVDDSLDQGTFIIPEDDSWNGCGDNGVFRLGDTSAQDQQQRRAGQDAGELLLQRATGLLLEPFLKNSGQLVGLCEAVLESAACAARESAQFGVGGDEARK